ncbi:putative methyltransferase (TIGR04325 family) [Azospirillum agricola]|uniref:methyltransferase, TIGR04325 family n=1 Tax=Azospirillum agricola TaxID=1720247 RepID=UPI001AE60D60|nr:methyltransferase, TIGR04325 family [Azospirillum agricola]MBP2232913.1 putative methyltransferase (TIGR04325 family) [Azospirillum agricola]
MGIFSGPYASLALAEARSQRYDDDRIVSRLVETRQAHLQWEGMLDPLHQQLGAALLAGALRGGSAGKPLRVCDFGGGLGAAYTILDAILGPSVELEWDVVETPAMARAGNAQFAQKGLRFYESIDALGDREHDVIIVSGVFQYLPEPVETFAQLARRPHHHMVVNRFPIREGSEEVLEDACLVQDMALIESGMFLPHWGFSRQRWRAVFGATHDTVYHWTDGFDGCHSLDDGSEMRFIGLLLARHPSSSP